MHVSFYKYEKTILISQGNGGEGVDKAVGKAADDLLQAACSIFYKLYEARGMCKTHVKLTMPV